MEARKEADHLLQDSKSLLAAIKEREDGQGLLEYALILSFVAILVLGTLTAVGTGISGLLTTVAGAV